MSYRNTLQAEALKRVAEELGSALAVGGDLPEDWLAAFGDGGSDLLMALVRQPIKRRKGRRGDGGGGLHPSQRRRGQC